MSLFMSIAMCCPNVCFSDTCTQSRAVDPKLCSCMLTLLILFSRGTLLPAIKPNYFGHKTSLFFVFLM